MRHHAEEVVPTNVLTTGLRNRHVNQVAGPSDGAESEQNSQVVVQAGFGVFEPSKGRTELGLQVQPTSEQSPSRQDHHEDGSLIQLGIRGHADRIKPVIET